MTTAIRKKPTARTLSYSRLRGVLHLAQSGKAEVAYYLDRLDAPAGSYACRLTKIIPPRGGEPREYDVLISPDGFDSCCCLGFLRWSRCKHVASVRCLRERGSL